METRASHLLIGTFVLIMVAAAFGFVMWLAKIEIDREFNHYFIYFEGSVSGLSPAGEVRYNGVPVGTVQTIAIDPKQPGKIKVGIEIASTTPIKEDSVATLELQGITGVSYVQLTGGTLESPVLKRKKGETRPVIASKKSQIDELFSGAPELINRFITLVSEATKVFDENNRQAIGEILASVQEITTTVASRRGEIDRILTNVSRTSDAVREAAENTNVLLAGLDDDLARLTDGADVTMAMMRGTLSSVDATLEYDAQPMLQQTKAAAASFEKMSTDLDRLLVENDEVLTDFFGEGLFEITRLVQEMRLMVDNLNHVAARIESDPTQFLFGDSQKGYQAK